MRLFIAADLPNAVREAIAREQKGMAAAIGRSGSSLRWVKPEHAHLTLVFIGNVEDARVPAVVDAVGREIDAAPFDVVFQGAGVFPPRGAMMFITTLVPVGELASTPPSLTSASAVVSPAILIWNALASL